MDKKTFLQKLKSDRIVVVGAGRSGIAAAELLSVYGYNVIVIDTDVKVSGKNLLEQFNKINVPLIVSEDSYKNIQSSDIVVLSPGIKPSSNIYKRIFETKAYSISELDLGYLFCKAPIVAVTGSNGKSTVVSLVSEILKRTDRTVWLCGNIGIPLSSYAGKIKEDDIVVCEVSSFQLYTSNFFHPHVAVILNVFDNHLDWHSDMTEYVDAKKKIFEKLEQDDWLILNADDSIVKTLSEYTKAKSLFFSVKDKVCGAYKNGDKIFYSLDAKDAGREICAVGDSNLIGIHNVANLAVSSLVGVLYGLNSDQIREAVKSFKALEHRCEFVGKIDGVSFINDSKSTTPSATEAALTSFDKKVVLIAGGKDKGTDFSKLKEVVKQKVHTMILIGQASEKISGVFKDVVPVIPARDLKDAVELGYNFAAVRKMDVLFSPMCASFDMFKNFEHRGEVFKEEVKNKIAAEISKAKMGV